MDKNKITYEQEVALVIDAQYSIDAQIAILRQKDEKPDEYAEFFAFCEDAKRKVKEGREDNEDNGEA